MSRDASDIITILKSYGIKYINAIGIDICAALISECALQGIPINSCSAVDDELVVFGPLQHRSIYLFHECDQLTLTVFNEYLDTLINQ